MEEKTFKTMDSQLPSKGKVIIHDLNEVLLQIKQLEPFCTDYLHALHRCENNLIHIAVEVACVCMGDSENWERVVCVLQESGITLPEELR